jgi:hypothetical protein
VRKTLPANIEPGRITSGPYASTRFDRHGAFRIDGPCGIELVIMSSGPDELYGWEHVSVSGKNRPPNWQEMCFVKNLFWEDEECVVQFHPPNSRYVNCHPNCLHLWRNMSEQPALPPMLLVGPSSPHK